MNYSQLQNPPASEHLLDEILKKVLLRSFRNLDTSIISFEGSGKRSLFLYLLRNHNLIDEFKNDHIFTWLTLDDFCTSRDKFFRDSLGYIKNVFGDLLNKADLDKLNEYLNLPNLTLDKFNELIYHLTYKSNIHITFVVFGADLLFEKDAKYNEIRSFMTGLIHLNPTLISYIFICQAELDQNDISSVQDVSLNFLKNVIWNTDIPFEKESALCLFENQSKRSGVNFSDDFIKSAIEASSGDPFVLKQIATRAIEDENFNKNFGNLSTIEEKYNLIGKDWLDTRYNSICKKLKNSTKIFLYNFNADQCPEFLVKTGLLKIENNEIKFINPLFKYFIENNWNFKNSITDTNTLEVKSQDLQLIPSLTAKEAQVLSLLIDNKSLVVSKEKIAQEIWGSEWTQNYSDWAIDKIISNIRKKYITQNMICDIKSAKGQGYLLV